MPVRLNGAPVDERTLRAIAAFILLYVGFWVVGASVIAIDSAIGDVPLGALDTLALSANALGNGGPGFGITGPFASFAPLGDVSKVTMILLMWLGRLEIIPVVVLLDAALLAPLRTRARQASPLRAEQRFAQRRPRVVRDDREHLVARAHDRARLHELRPAVAEDRDEARALGQREPADPRAGDRGVALDLHLDDLEALLLAAGAAARGRARAPRARRGRGCSSSRRPSA